VRELAGKISALAGIIPYLAAFNRSLHKVGHEEGGAGMAFTRQINHDLKWAHSVLQRDSGLDICRVYRLRRAAGAGVVLQTDASLEGVGAVLFIDGHPTAYLSEAIADDGPFAQSVQRWLQIPDGEGVEPAMVPSLEFLTVLLGLRTWTHLVRHAVEDRVQVAVRTDSAAAMGAALTWRSPSKKLNEVAKEMAADAAAGLFVLDLVEHVPGLANVWADMLSHLSVPEELLLAQAEKASTPVLDEAFWLTRAQPPSPARCYLTPGPHGVPPDRVQ
jgi:hypothetical protein